MLFLMITTTLGDYPMEMRLYAADTAERLADKATVIMRPHTSMNEEEEELFKASLIQGKPWSEGNLYACISESVKVI